MKRDEEVVQFYCDALGQLLVSSSVRLVAFRIASSVHLARVTLGSALASAFGRLRVVGHRPLKRPEIQLWPAPRRYNFKLNWRHLETLETSGDPRGIWRPWRHLETLECRFFTWNMCRFSVPPPLSGGILACPNGNLHLGGP